MAVYTEVSDQQVGDLLADYGLGQLKRISGIVEGVTNSVYMIETTNEGYILVLFEELDSETVQVYPELMRFLSEHNIPCPSPLIAKNNHSILEISNHPVLLYPFLMGKEKTEMSVEDCKQVGEMLGHFHQVGQQFPKHISDQRGAEWRRRTAEELYPELSDDDALILHEEIEFQESLNVENLPRGIIHADLFMDNVLFNDGKITGLLDVFYACTDILVYDLAIVLSDWCYVGGGKFDEIKKNAILDAYQKVRPLTELEISSFPSMLRRVALRFWLSRLYDFYFQQRRVKGAVRDPDYYKERLMNYRSA